MDDALRGRSFQRGQRQDSSAPKTLRARQVSLPLSCCVRPSARTPGPLRHSGQTLLPSRRGPRRIGSTGPPRRCWSGSLAYAIAPARFGGPGSSRDSWASPCRRPRETWWGSASTRYPSRPAGRDEADPHAGQAPQGVFEDSGGGPVQPGQVIDRDDHRGTLRERADHGKGAQGDREGWRRVFPGRDSLERDLESDSLGRRQPIQDFIDGPIEQIRQTAERQLGLRLHGSRLHRPVAAPARANEQGTQDRCLADPDGSRKDQGHRSGRCGSEERRRRGILRIAADQRRRRPEDSGSVMSTCRGHVRMVARNSRRALVLRRMIVPYGRASRRPSGRHAGWNGATSENRTAMISARSVAVALVRRSPRSARSRAARTRTASL